MHPVLERRDDGVVLSDLSPWFVSVLLEVPELLSPDQPDAVKRRLYPDPRTDEEARLEWHKFVHPELFALIASAREVVQRDLLTLAPSAIPNPLGLWTIEIPRAHESAWISGLNAARLTLGERFGIDEADMRQDEEGPHAAEDTDDGDDAVAADDATAAAPTWTDKQIAITKIHLLAVIQQLLIEGQPECAEGYPGTGS